MAWTLGVLGRTHGRGCCRGTYTSAARYTLRNNPYGTEITDCGMYIPLSDDKHQMVRDSSKKRTGQHGRNSNPVAMLPHAAVVFCMQPFHIYWYRSIAYYLTLSVLSLWPFSSYLKLTIWV